MHARQPVVARALAALPFSPAAERNAPHILAVLSAHLPARANVLEVASGTGQHAAHFAAAQPGWLWQTTEGDEPALACIAARCAGLSNVQPPLLLDVCAESWPVAPAAFDAVYLANLTHIAAWAATPALMRGSGRCLAEGGVLWIYGPFIVEGESLAPSNAAFDADLRARNPQWGLRHLRDVAQAAAAAGLVLEQRQAMPTNNVLLRFVRGTAPA